VYTIHTRTFHGASGDAATAITAAQDLASNDSLTTTFQQPPSVAAALTYDPTIAVWHYVITIAYTAPAIDLSDFTSMQRELQLRGHENTELRREIARLRDQLNGLGADREIVTDLRNLVDNLNATEELPPSELLEVGRVLCPICRQNLNEKGLGPHMIKKHNTTPKKWRKEHNALD
jgi:hypothetical protein